MAPEGTSPRSEVNVPGDYFSLAGFEVTTYGRFWVLCRASCSSRLMLSIAVAKLFASRGGTSSPGFLLRRLPEGNRYAR